MWTDIQVDLETMGLPPDGAIVAIGACFFDIPARTIGPTFYRSIHLATAVRLGMTIDPSTVAWWMRQPDEARLAVVNNTADIVATLHDFSAFIDEHSRVQDVRPWGNGASFDLTLLSTAYKLAGVERPWSFGRERCFRTVRNMYPSVEYATGNRVGTHHHALDDAIYQAKHLFAIADR